jgi:hypothetical protein
LSQCNGCSCQSLLSPSNAKDKATSPARGTQNYLHNRIAESNVEVSRHFVHGHEALKVTTFPLLHGPGRSRGLETREALRSRVPEGGGEGREGVKGSRRSLVIAGLSPHASV